MKKLIRKKLTKIYLRNQYGLHSITEFIKGMVSLQIGLACILFIFCMVVKFNILMLFIAPLLSVPFFILGAWFIEWLDEVSDDIKKNVQESD